MRDTLVCIGLLVAVAYVIYLFGMPHYGHMMYKTELQALKRMPLLSDEEVIEKALEQAYALDIDLRPENIRLERDPGTRRPGLIVEWDDSVYFMGKHLVDYHFRIDTTRKGP